MLNQVNPTHTETLSPPFYRPLGACSLPEIGLVQCISILCSRSSNVAMGTPLQWMFIAGKILEPKITKGWIFQQTTLDEPN